MTSPAEPTCRTAAFVTRAGTRRLHVDVWSATDPRLHELARGEGADYEDWLEYWMSLAPDERDPLSYPAWFAGHLANAELGSEPRVLMIRDGAGRLRAPLPVQVNGRGPGVALEHARGFDCKSIALRSSDVKAFCEVLFSGAIEGLGRVRSLLLSEVEETNALLQVDWPSLNAAGWHRSLIEVADGYDAMMARLSSKARNNVRRVRRKMEQEFAVGLETIAAAAEIDAAFDRYLCVDDHSWKHDRNGGSTLREDQPQLRSLRQAMRSMSVVGRAVVQILTADGRDVAAQLCCLVDDQLHLVKTSYDNELARLAPGKVLLDATLRDYCPAHGVAAVNMVTGLNWHRQWKPRLLRTQAHWLFAQGPLGAWGRAVDVPPRTRAVDLLRQAGLEEGARRLRARLVR